MKIYPYSSWQLVNIDDKSWKDNIQHNFKKISMDAMFPEFSRSRLDVMQQMFYSHVQRQNYHSAKDKITISILWNSSQNSNLHIK